MLHGLSPHLAPRLQKPWSSWTWGPAPLCPWSPPWAPCWAISQGKKHLVVLGKSLNTNPSHSCPTILYFQALPLGSGIQRALQLGCESMVVITQQLIASCAPGTRSAGQANACQTPPHYKPFGFGVGEPMAPSLSSPCFCSLPKSAGKGRSSTRGSLLPGQVWGGCSAAPLHARTATTPFTSAKLPARLKEAANGALMEPW